MLTVATETNGCLSIPNIPVTFGLLPSSHLKKPTNMPKKIAFTAVIAVISIIAILVLWSESNSSNTDKVCCEKTSPACNKQEKQKAADDVIMENLSRQFIHISPLGF
jgi:uncharacterized membrane protein YvbJ